MTYRPAVEHARPLGQRGWTVPAYVEHRIRGDRAREYAACGISPDLAGQLRPLMLTPGQVQTLATILAPSGIRALLAGYRLSPGDIPTLARMAEVSLPATRAWVHRTEVALDNADRLQTWGVRPSSVAAWVAIDPLRRPADPYTLLTLTRIALGADDDLDGWLRFCVRHDVPYAGPGTDGTTLLGGDVAVMIRAGMSAREADRLVRTGRYDRDATLILAGLRS